MKNNKLVYILVGTLFLTSCGSSMETASEPASADYLMDYATEESKSYDGGGNDASVSEAPVLAKTSSSETGYNFTNGGTQYKRDVKFAKVGTIENTTESNKFSFSENKEMDFDETVAKAESVVSKYKGYFQTANYTMSYKKSFSSTIKVPVENFQDLFNELKSTGINVYNESNSVNETAGYYSIKSQLDVQKLSKERLEELIDNTTNSKDLLKFYDSYYDLVANIEIMEASLSQIESETSYSTIYFSLSDGSQVIRTDDVSFFSKIKYGLGTSVGFIGEVILGLAYISIPLLLFLIIALFGYKKLSKILKNKSKKEIRKLRKNKQEKLKPEEITKQIQECKHELEENDENKNY